MRFTAGKPKVPVLNAINFTQAGAVQNTWYTVGTYYNVDLYGLAIGCTVANETLEARITIDGLVFNILAGIAVTAAQFSQINGVRFQNPAAPTFEGAASAAIVYMTAATAELKDQGLVGRIMVIETRKSTATGASALRVVGLYGQW